MWTNRKESLRQYIVLLCFWPVEGIVKLADRPTGCCEVVKGGCPFALNFNVTRSAALTEVERKH
jgi:hypothetical protein